MIQTCEQGLCRCRHPLFTVDGFTGQVEVKCPRCRRLHLYTYRGGQPPTHEVRCNNWFRGDPMLGGWCGQLIARISSDADGGFGYRCPSCKETKTIRIEAASGIII